MRRSNRSPPIPLSLTPMIDIVFQLIAFFVFALNYDRAKINAAIVPPLVDYRDEESVDDVRIIEIDAQGRLWTPHGPVHPRDADYARTLGTLLEGESPQRKIVIRADQAAPYATISCVLHECRRRTLTSVTLRVRLPENSSETR